MSYESVKLTLMPVAWYRNDELTGTTMFDSSGNDHHQVYEQHEIDPILLGQVSGVETVPESRSIHGFNRISQWIVSLGDAFDSRITFTWEALVRQTNDHPANKTIIARDATGNGSRLFFSGSGTISALFALRIGGVTFDITANINPLLNSWYHVIGVRNGGTMFLMLNGVVVATRADLPPSTPIDVAGTDRIAVGATAGGNTFQWQGNSEEFTFYDYALTSTQGLAVYESMINALFISGRADAGPTGILRSDFDPDPVEFPWRHNWTEPLVERISFRSAVSQSVNGVEEGVSQRISPRRELEFNQLIRGNVERRKLRAQLWANQTAKWFVPVRQYAEQLLAPLSATDTTTPINTALKDYESGSWIGFRQYAADGSVEHSEVRQITALNINSIEHEALINAYVAYRSIVYPVRRALIPSLLTLRGHTDSVEELTLTFRLLPEDEALIPNRITAFSPSIKYRDVEVFDGQLWQSNDWSEQREYEVERTGEAIDFENGLMGFESDTIGASETFSYRMTLSGHTNIAAFLGWFYERRGTLAYLWVPSMQEDVEVLSVGATTVTVRDTNYSDSYALAEPRRDLAFIYFDGSMEFRRVIGFSGTTNETLTLDAVVPTLTNLRMVSLLKYCRMDADQLELAWQTDSVAQVAWRFREALHTPEGTGRSSLSPSASLSGSVSPSGSASPSSSVSPSLSPSLSPSPSASTSPSASISPSSSASPSASISATPSLSPSPSASVSSSPSASQSPSGSESLSPSPSASASPSV